MLDDPAQFAGDGLEGLFLDHRLAGLQDRIVLSLDLSGAVRRKQVGVEFSDEVRGCTSVEARVGAIGDDQPAILVFHRQRDRDGVYYLAEETLAVFQFDLRDPASGYLAADTAIARWGPTVLQQPLPREPGTS